MIIFSDANKNTLKSHHSFKTIITTTLTTTNIMQILKRIFFYAQFKYNDCFFLLIFLLFWALIFNSPWKWAVSCPAWIFMNHSKCRIHKKKLTMYIGIPTMCFVCFVFSFLANFRKLVSQNLSTCNCTQNEQQEKKIARKENIKSIK